MWFFFCPISEEQVMRFGQIGQLTDASCLEDKRWSKSSQKDRRPVFSYFTMKTMRPPNAGRMLAVISCTFLWYYAILNNALWRRKHCNKKKNQFYSVCSKGQNRHSLYISGRCLPCTRVCLIFSSWHRKWSSLWQQSISFIFYCNFH